MWCAENSKKLVSVSFNKTNITRMKKEMPNRIEKSNFLFN